MLTLSELAEAHARGEVTGTMWIDNDQVSFSTPDGELLYEAHPADLITQALDVLGLTHESV